MTFVPNEVEKKEEEECSQGTKPPSCYPKTDLSLIKQVNLGTFKGTYLDQYGTRQKLLNICPFTESYISHHKLYLYIK